MLTLEEFYADPRRRGSREIKFGSNWRSETFGLFEFAIFWLSDTQELCALRSPIRDVREDGMFNRFILGVPPIPMLRLHAMTSYRSRC